MYDTHKLQRFSQDDYRKIDIIIAATNENAVKINQCVPQFVKSKWKYVEQPIVSVEMTLLRHSISGGWSG